MFYYATINASDDQIKKIYNKYLKKRVFNISYSTDQEDNVGFITCSSNPLGSTDILEPLNFGVIMSWQMRDGKPCFFTLVKGSIRYETHSPEDPIFGRLQNIGLKASKRFWKGGSL